MTIVRILVGGLLLSAVPAFAQQQVDISGEWAARVHEDQPHRGPGAELGDYTGLPINDAARQKASHWDASVLALPERMAQPHPAVYFMRGPGPNMRIIKRVDPVTQELVAYTLEGVFGRDDRIIWMDGRPHPSPNAEYLWEGFSTGKVEGNRLTITTTHMRYGVIQRNGVPASTKATMTEHFIRHGDQLTLMTIVDDPVYLEEPFVRTSHWVRSSNITVGSTVALRGRRRSRRALDRVRAALPVGNETGRLREEARHPVRGHARREGHDVSRVRTEDQGTAGEEAVVAGFGSALTCD